MDLLGDFQSWIDAMENQTELQNEKCPLDTSRFDAMENQTELQNEKCPEVSASFDASWQQCGLMRIYNSVSSHSFTMGKCGQKAIEKEIKSKLCSFHTAWEKNHPG